MHFLIDDCLLMRVVVEIKGIFALVSSANIDEPDLVIAKFTFEKYSATLSL